MSNPTATPLSSGPPQTPGCPHDYPVSATSKGFSPAVGLALKTLPYALLRYLEWVVLAALCAVFLAATAGGAVALYTYVHPYAGGAVLVGGALGLVFWLLPLVERQAFQTHCGHIYLLTALITKGRIDNDQRSLFDYGRASAGAQLGELESVWDVHRSIDRAARRLARSLNMLDRWVPIDLSSVKRAMYKVVNWAMPYVDAVVLSYGMARGDRDFSKAGLDGLCYSIQNGKTVLRSAVGAFVLEKVLLAPLWLVTAVGFTAGAFVLVLSVGGGDLATLQANPRAYFQAEPIVALTAVASGIVLGVLFAHLTVKTVAEAFVKPALTTMVLLNFHLTVQHQALDMSLRNQILEADEGLDELAHAAARVSRAAS